ncbi:hypothetical protein [Verminephrobacter eiseniae]|uniref:hypothetical protein n=1 Tax=Verminephrobacter eiseniae TaxID=364317 RepID=UPI0022380C18|nr:hypothetical protein [Verminephrobacter eiseniae]MCW5292650.1 hypothetical protein [Verminephrobacter eiseniae]
MDIHATVIQRLGERHGWSPDRLLNNVLQKEYQTAVAPKMATLWLTFDAEYSRYWLKGEFVSAGVNALASCIECIPCASDLDTVHTKVDALARDAEQAIAGSYAVRLLRGRSLPGSAAPKAGEKA